MDVPKPFHRIIRDRPVVLSILLVRRHRLTLTLLLVMRVLSVPRRLASPIINTTSLDRKLTRPLPT